MQLRARVGIIDMYTNHGATMHHITYRTYAGDKATVELPAAEILKVLFFVKSLSEAGIEYKHTFID